MSPVRLDIMLLFKKNGSAAKFCYHFGATNRLFKNIYTKVLGNQQGKIP